MQETSFSQRSCNKLRYNDLTARLGQWSRAGRVDFPAQEKLTITENFS